MYIFTIEDLQKAVYVAKEHQQKERKDDENDKWRKIFRGFANLLETTELGDKREIGRAHLNMGNTYIDIGEYQKAIDCYRKHLKISEELGDNKGVGGTHGNMGIVYTKIGEHQKAIDCHRKDLEIAEKLGDRVGIARAHANMGNVYSRIGEYQKAMHCHRKDLEIAEELGDKGGIGRAYVNLGNAYNRIGEYQKAINCYRKDLEIAEELCDKRVMGRAHENMGNAYNKTGEYQKAIDCHRKHLKIAEELGNKRWEETANANLGNAFHNIGEYQKAIDYHCKHLEIAKEIDDKEGIGGAHANMGAAYHDIGEYQKAIDCHRKDLEIAEELGNKGGVGRAHANMGNVYHGIGEYQKSIDCHRKYLRIAQELRDKRGVGRAHGSMGTVYKEIGQYQKAFDCHRKHLMIAEELGDKYGIGGAQSGMGIVYNIVGEYQKAIDCHLKHLEIAEELGDKGGVGRSHSNMGCAYRHIGQYKKAIDCHRKNLEIAGDMGDKTGVGNAHCNMGTSYWNIGQYQKALDCFHKHLEISEVIGDICGVAIAQSNLGEFHQRDNDCLASSFFAKSILSYQKIRRFSVYQDEFNTSISNKYADVHKLLLKSLLNLKQVKSALLVSDSGKAKALYDLTRRCVDIVMDSALEENFTIPIQAISDDPCSKTTEAFFDVVLSKVIYLMQDGNIISYTFDCHQNLHAWVISRKGVFHKQWKPMNGMSAKTYLETVNRGLGECFNRNLPKHVSYCTEVYSFDGNVKKNNLDPIFIGNKDERANNFARDLERRVEKLTRINNARETVNCDPNISVLKSLKERYNLDSPIACKYGKNSDESGKDEEKLVRLYSLETPKIIASQIEKDINYRGDPSEQETAIESYLKKQYSIYISPIEEYLVGSRILVVPEGSLFKAPFCALLNSKKEHLCERYSLQFTPSLHVLNASLSKPLPIIGPALFVGNPIVGDVKFNDVLVSIPQLPNAKVEAGECSKYFSAEPFLDENATKMNVLKSMKDASVIHIAAHGHMNHADIFLAPNEGAPKPPSEEYYLLTAKDIVECTLNARLVVLSCCHSGRGQISAEGVVGIARSFLGSGARSVLVTLWKILDEETMVFMKLFYDKVVQGLSVCVALQQTMIEVKKKYSMAAWTYFQIVGEDISLTKEEIEEIRRQSSTKKTNSADDAELEEKEQKNVLKTNESNREDCDNNTNVDQVEKENIV